MTPATRSASVQLEPQALQSSTIGNDTPTTGASQEPDMQYAISDLFNLDAPSTEWLPYDSDTTITLHQFPNPQGQRCDLLVDPDISAADILSLNFAPAQAEQTYGILQCVNNNSTASGCPNGILPWTEHPRAWHGNNLADIHPDPLALVICPQEISNVDAISNSTAQTEIFPAVFHPTSGYSQPDQQQALLQSVPSEPLISLNEPVSVAATFGHTRPDVESGNHMVSMQTTLPAYATNNLGVDTTQAHTLQKGRFREIRSASEHGSVTQTKPCLPHITQQNMKQEVETIGQVRI